MRYLLAWLIGGYQKISRLTPAVCRFYPTCSAYAKTALLRYGVLRGGFLAVRRLLRCNPWNAGGIGASGSAAHPVCRTRTPAYTTQQKGLMKTNGFFI